MIFVSAISRQPRRLTLAANTPPPPTPATYIITRADAGYSLVAPTSAWLVGTATLELALSPALEEGVEYIVSAPSLSGTPSARFRVYGGASAAPPPSARGEDPAAEAYGVDRNWLSGVLSADGDLVEVRGRQCLLNDVQAVALIAPREIYHRPEDGAGLFAFVNASGTPFETDLMRARLRRQWLKDSRIAKVESVDIVVDSTGIAKIPAKLTEAVLGEPFDVLVPGG